MNISSVLGSFLLHGIGGGPHFGALELQRLHGQAVARLGADVKIAVNAAKIVVHESFRKVHFLQCKVYRGARIWTRPLCGLCKSKYRMFKSNKEKYVDMLLCYVKYG